MQAKAKNIESCQNVHEVLDYAGLNFNPIRQDLITLDGVQIEGYKGIYRSDNQKTLSVMGADYTAFPPAQTFAIADVLRERYNLKYSRAISIDGGKRIVIELESEKFSLGGREDATKRIRIGDSLDGSTRFYAQAGVWRMICTNGLWGWKMEHVLSIRHTKHAQDRLKEATRIWLKSESAFADIERQAEILMQKVVTDSMIEKFLDSIVGEVTDKTSTRKKNQRDDILNLFNHGKGNHGRTAWDLVNGVTEYYQHEVNPNNPESRLASSIFGTGNDQANKAVKLALAL